MSPTRSSNSAYIFDTVVLANFALANRLDLLTTRYGPRLLVLHEVLNEITAGVVAGYFALHAVEKALARKELSTATGISSSSERDTYRTLLRTLGPGEAACIAYAKHHGGIVVTDDRAAREHCRDYGLPFTGTIGILKACCRDGQLSPEDADSVLLSMIEAGYYSPVQKISNLM